LFEYKLMELYGDQLSSVVRQCGFTKHSGCFHALFTFKRITEYLIKTGSKVYLVSIELFQLAQYEMHALE